MDNSSAPPAPAAVTETLDAKTSGSSDSPGWKTTEFWLHLLTILGIVGTSLAGAGLPARWAAVCATASAASYSIARGLAKQGNAN